MSLTVTEPPPTDRAGRAILTAADLAVLESLDFVPMTPGDGPTFTDLFCGAGGSSIGLTEAGLRLVLAANHWPRAIETHSDNFRWAEHQCVDIDHYDMRRLPRTQVLWASPICTEASPASGNARQRRPKGQLDLFEQDGHVEQAGFERTRATFYDVMRAAEVHRYDVVVLENVPEVAAKWELFDWWVSGMTNVLPYNVQFVSVSSAHVGGEGNPWAPQWRNRLYIVLTRKGIPLPDVEPRPLAWCPACDEIVHAFQAWKKPGARKIGKYGEQYVYLCPNTGCRHTRVEPFVLPAASAIDWSDLGRPIGERKRTAAKPEGLAPSTMARIRAGVPLLGQPASVPFLTLLRSGRIRNLGPWNEPLAAIMADGSGHGLVVPVGGNNHDQPAAGTDIPFRTRVTRETDAVVTPPDAFLLKNHGGYCTPEQNVTPVGTPVSAVTVRDSHALVVPYRKARAATTGEPLHTMATRDSAALVRPDDAVDISEWKLRMLKPREHLRAQRFRDSYRVHGNPSEQTMQAGNAVSANVAHWLGRQVVEVL